LAATKKLEVPPIPEGVRLTRFSTHLGVSTTLTNASGYTVPCRLEGGQVRGDVRWIVATPEGVRIGVEDDDHTWKQLLFNAAGYGVVE